jgi:hypothetical protein
MKKIKIRLLERKDWKLEFKYLPYIITKDSDMKAILALKPKK